MNKHILGWLSVSCLLIISFLLLQSCEGPETSSKFPGTREDWIKSLEMSKPLISESISIVDSLITEAYDLDGEIDKNKIIKCIESIDGVLSAKENISGTGLIVRLEDSTHYNLPIIRMDDPRVFAEISEKSSIFETGSDLFTKNISFVPNGSGKALILAPFQDHFFHPLNKISNLLKSVGYNMVEIITNEDANLDVFKGNFLNDYDIIIIFTHSGHGLDNETDVDITHLAVREARNVGRIIELSLDQYMSLEVVGIGGLIDEDIDYYGITASWLNLTTTDGDFSNSWIFLGGCNTMFLQDLSLAFIDLGAGGVNGWKSSVTTGMNGDAAVKMTSEFSAGLSFSESSNAVRNDPSLTRISWFERFYEAESHDISKFANTQKGTEPFYLFDPNSPPDLIFMGSNIENDNPAILMIKFNTILNNIVPTTSSFTVTVNSVQRPINSVSLLGTSVYLTLASPVKKGDIVTVSYTKPTTNPLQTISGKQADSFTAQPVANNVTTTNSGIFFNPNKVYGNVTDIDGNIYKTIQIGTQIWMAENLKTQKYNDGEIVGLVNDDPDLISTTPGYRWVNKDPNTFDTYGLAYNWYAVNTKKLCPTGWHVSSHEDWQILANHLGGWNEGNKLREEGYLHWPITYYIATNESGFTALPNGRIYTQGVILNFGKEAAFWTSDPSAIPNYARPKIITDIYITPYADWHQGFGLAVRCVKN